MQTVSRHKPEYNPKRTPTRRATPSAPRARRYAPKSVPLHLADQVARANRLVRTTQHPIRTTDRRVRLRTYPTARAVELLDMPLLQHERPKAAAFETSGYNKSGPYTYTADEGWQRSGFKPSQAGKWPHVTGNEADQAEKALRSLKSSRYRARARMTDRCLMMGAKVLLTLTTRGPYTVDELWPLVRSFTKRLHAELPAASFIEVPELHSAGGANHGGCHFHVPCSHFIPASKARRIWHEVLTGEPGTKHGQASPGNIDVQFRPHATPADMAYYVAKRLVGYITKDIEAEAQGGSNEKGRKRYRCSGAKIPPTPETVFYVAEDTDLAWLFAELTGQAVKGQHIELVSGYTATIYRTIGPVEIIENPSMPLSERRPA